MTKFESVDELINYSYDAADPVREMIESKDSPFVDRYIETHLNLFILASDLLKITRYVSLGLIVIPNIYGSLLVFPNDFQFSHSVTGGPHYREKSVDMLNLIRPSFTRWRPAARYQIWRE